MLGSIRAVEPQLPTLIPCLMDTAHADARLGRRPPFRNGNTRDASEGTLPPRLASEGRTMPKVGPAALVGRPDGYRAFRGAAWYGMQRASARSDPRGVARWEEMTADMLRVTADLNDRDDTAINDRFKGQNREVLEQMRHAERDACSAVEHRLGDHDRDLREQQK